MSPTAGGFYAAGLRPGRSPSRRPARRPSRSTSKQPDQWLLGELSATPGEVVQKKYVEAKGKAFGTVTGGTMCSGPFKLDSWKTGQGVKMVPNPDYWDTCLPTPKVKSLTVIGVPDDATLTAGLTSGSIDGDLRHRAQHPRPAGAPTRRSSVYQGAPYATVVDGHQRHQGPAGRRPPGVRPSPRPSTVRASSTPSTRAPAASRTPLPRAAPGATPRASSSRRTTRCRR